MPHKLRKTRKKRGSRTHGYGRVGQHRKTGSKGYRKAGRHKHGWSYILRYEPEYFSKKGFTSPKSLKVKENVINVGKLDEMTEKSQMKDQEKSYIDLERLGYTKLLGTGKVTKPLKVKVAACSSSAAEKIKAAGGEIITVDEKHGE